MNAVCAGCWRHQRFVLNVAIVTLVATILLYILVPKGLLPQQDTGVIIGVTDAAENISFKAMVQTRARGFRYRPARPGRRQRLRIGRRGNGQRHGQHRADFISCSSRTTSGANAGENHRTTAECHAQRRRRFALYASGAGSADRLPRQPHSIPIHLAGCRRGGTARSGRRNLCRNLRNCRNSAMWPAISRSNGLQLNVDVDREKASRLNVLTQAIDDTLYDAFGQRQVSIIFTQLNQFRVILEVEPQFRRITGFARQNLREIEQRPASAAQRVRHDAREQHAAVHPASGTISRRHHLVQLAAAAVRSVRPSRQFKKPNAKSACRIRLRLRSPARRRNFVRRSRASRCSSSPRSWSSTSCSAFFTRATFIRSRFFRPCPAPGVGALLALLICRIDFSLVALIGIILLIGIVKKNAIMMIDFALEAERKEGMSPEESIYQACLLRFRPIMMTTAAALLGALPLALENGTGSELRRPLGISIVGGLVALAISHPLHHAGNLSLSRSVGSVDRGTPASRSNWPGRTAVRTSTL